MSPWDTETNLRKQCDTVIWYSDNQPIIQKEFAATIRLFLSLDRPIFHLQDANIPKDVLSTACRQNLEAIVFDSCLEPVIMRHRC